MKRTRCWNIHALCDNIRIIPNSSTVQDGQIPDPLTNTEVNDSNDSECLFFNKHQVLILIFSFSSLEISCVLCHVTTSRFPTQFADLQTSSRLYASETVEFSKFQYDVELCCVTNVCYGFQIRI